MKKAANLLTIVCSKYKYSFFIMAVLMLWLKTYAAYVVEFNLGITNATQEFLLFLNPLSSTLLFLGMALFIKNKLQPIFLIVIHFFVSFVLYANIVYYRFFSDFITVPVIKSAMVNDTGQLGGSALELMSVTDIFYFIDTVVLILLLVSKVYKPRPVKSRIPAFLCLCTAVAVFYVNVSIAEEDRPDLLKRSFDRNYLIKYLGAYNFTIYDIVQNIRSERQRALANNSHITEVENYIRANYTEPNPAYFGKGEGRNVIYIALESLQSFIMDYKIQDQEVMPFLNSLARHENTFYFPNFFHQTSQGKTSDAEFMLENSLFPSSQGAVFVNKAQNTFHSAPAILKTKGYTSAVFHGNHKTFWNRNEMYRSLGFDAFFDAEYYSMSEENTKNYGMKDKPFVTESFPLLESLQQPFYSKFLLLSNHFPFEMDPLDTDFPAGETGNNVVDHYFQSAHYMDEAVEQFFEQLKASNLYENSIIVLYGDHYGISDNHNKAMAQVLGKDVITDFDYIHLQRVPLFIHIPGVEGKLVNAFGGQVDVMPTLMHLLGIDTRNYLQIGSDLLAEEHNQLVPFRDGNFVSPEVTKIGDHYYSTLTGELITDQVFKELSERVTLKLSISDEIVFKDLLRFHKPDGFVPINRNDYHYIKKDVMIPAENDIYTEYQ